MINNKSKLLIFTMLSAVLIFSMLIVSAAQLPVNLGEADHFVILSEAQITDANAATSLITGDVGVHPAAGTLIQDVSCSTVTGIIYDNNAGYTGGFDSDFTCLLTDPVLLGNAVSDMDTARLDAQGRITNDVTRDTNELDTGLLSPTTPSFKPGLHTWSTGVTITDSITLNGEGNTNSVFIFQIAQTLIVNNGAIITLTNGAQAKNIFWVVSDATTLGTTSIFEGTILSVTGISTLADSTVHGRLLAQTAITLDGTTNKVTIPGTMPAAPIVTNDDDANTVSGIDATMEYKLDADVNYTAYDAINFSTIDFSRAHTLFVRVAAEGINPFGPDTILTFTTNPVVPSGGSSSGGGSSGEYQFGGRIAETTTAGNTTSSGTETTTNPPITVEEEPNAGTSAPITGAVTGIGSKILGLAVWVWALIVIGAVVIGGFVISLFKKK